MAIGSFVDGAEGGERRHEAGWLRSKREVISCSPSAGAGLAGREFPVHDYELRDAGREGLASSATQCGVSPRASLGGLSVSCELPAVGCCHLLGKPAREDPSPHALTLLPSEPRTPECLHLLGQHRCPWPHAATVMDIYRL